MTRHGAVVQGGGWGKRRACEDSVGVSGGDDETSPSGGSMQGRLTRCKTSRSRPGVWGRRAIRRGLCVSDSSRKVRQNAPVVSVPPPLLPLAPHSPVTYLVVRHQDHPFRQVQAYGDPLLIPVDYLVQVELIVIIVGVDSEDGWGPDHGDEDEESAEEFLCPGREGVVEVEGRGMEVEGKDEEELEGVDGEHSGLEDKVERRRVDPLRGCQGRPGSNRDGIRRGRHCFTLGRALSRKKGG